MNSHHLTYLNITLRFQVTKKILKSIFKYIYHKAQLLLESLLIKLILELFYVSCYTQSFPLVFSILPMSYQIQHTAVHTIFLPVTTVQPKNIYFFVTKMEFQASSKQ